MISVAVGEEAGSAVVGAGEGAETRAETGAGVGEGAGGIVEETQGVAFATSPPSLSLVKGVGLGATESASATEIAVAAIHAGSKSAKGTSTSPSLLSSSLSSHISPGMAATTTTPTPASDSETTKNTASSLFPPPVINGTNPLSDITEGEKMEQSPFNHLPKTSQAVEIEPNPEEPEEPLEEGEISESTHLGDDNTPPVPDSKDSNATGPSSLTLPPQSRATALASKKESKISSSTSSLSPPAETLSKGLTSTADSPLTKIVETLPSLPASHQDLITKNIARVGTYPRDMPLSVPWTLYFSDTSKARKGVSQEQYSQAQTPLFTATTVPAFCGSLKAYKNMVRPKRTRPGQGEQDSMGLTRPGQNLHFFRAGVEPSWEDKWNALGGRLTLSPSPLQFDVCTERLLLLLAGSALEARAAELLDTSTKPSPVPALAETSPQKPPSTGTPTEGLVLGVVASRRDRGDRIEIWLGGREKKETPTEWISRLSEALTLELNIPNLPVSRYKRHFAASS